MNGTLVLKTSLVLPTCKGLKENTEILKENKTLNLGSCPEICILQQLPWTFKGLQLVKADFISGVYL